MTGGVGRADPCGRSFRTDGRLRACGGRPLGWSRSTKGPVWLESRKQSKALSGRAGTEAGFLTVLWAQGVLRRGLLGSGGWRLAQGHNIVRAALGLEPVLHPLRRPGAHPEPPTPAPIPSVPTQKTLERQHLVCKEWGFQAP